MDIISPAGTPINEAASLGALQTFKRDSDKYLLRVVKDSGGKLLLKAERRKSFTTFLHRVFDAHSFKLKSILDSVVRPLCNSGKLKEDIASSLNKKVEKFNENQKAKRWFRERAIETIAARTISPAVSPQGGIAPFRSASRRAVEKSSSASSLGDIKGKNLTIVDYSTTSTAIKKQAENLFPRAIAQGEEIRCLCVGGKLLGAVHFRKVLSIPPTFDLSIEMTERRQGYGRILFESACDEIIRRGGIVVLTDSTMSEAGDHLYGGTKTREKFDVQFSIEMRRGYYRLRKKEGETKPLEYLPIDLPEKGYKLLASVENAAGMRRVIEYVKQHPEQKSEFLNLDLLEWAHKIGRLLPTEKKQMHESLINDLRDALHEEKTQPHPQLPQRGSPSKVPSEGPSSVTSRVARGFSPKAPPSKNEPARESSRPQGRPSPASVEPAAASKVKQASSLPAARSKSFTVEQANELVRTLTPETARQLVGEMTQKQKAGLLSAFSLVQKGGSKAISLAALYKYLETGTVEEGTLLSSIDMKKALEGFSAVVQQYVLHPDVNVPKVKGDDATKMELFLAYIVIARRLVMANSFKPGLPPILRSDRRQIDREA